MINEVLIFLNLFIVRKAFYYIFQYFRKSARKSKSKGFEGLRVSFTNKYLLSISLKVLEFFIQQHNIKVFPCRIDVLYTFK